MKHLMRMHLCFVMLCLLLTQGGGLVAAQEEEDLWSDPVNLSRSGAASEPVAVAGLDGKAQVFWWDRFDGITTAYYTPGLDEPWSEPERASIIFTQIVGEGENAEVVYTPIGAMPQIVGGTDDRAHAWWLGPADEETGLQPLFYSRIRVGTAAWTDPDEMAESALAWQMTAAPDGTLHLVYVRPVQSDAFPAGVYYKRSDNGGVTWSAPEVLYESIYFRLYEAETFHLTLTADDAGGVHAGWWNPRLEQTYLTLSADDGLTWSPPEALTAGEMTPQAAHVVPVWSAAPLLLWQPGQTATTCALYQQRFEGEAGWTTPVQVLEDVQSCPEVVHTHPITVEQTLLVADRGAGTVRLAAYQEARWSRVKSLGFSFEHPGLDRQIYLEALDVVPVGERLLVAGTGQMGDVWALTSEMETLTWAFAPPSPWRDPARISEVTEQPGRPSAAVDAEGRVHLLWRAGNGLSYAHLDGERWSRPATVLQTEGGVAEPMLLAAGEHLHAVWSGGPGGAIFYSRAYARDAYAAGGWSTPAALPAGGTTGSAPALASEGDGTLHAVYAAPLNEARGVYYTRSDDGGESWEAPVTVFDAAAEGWALVDHPALAFDERGVLHAAWVQGSCDGPFPPQALYYAHSMDGGETWSEAQIMGEGTYDWPHVVATFDGSLHLLWTDLDRGVWMERTSADYGATWSYQQQVRGFREVVGRVGLTSGGAGTLHLAGLAQDATGEPALLRTTWSDARWGELETVPLDGVQDLTEMEGAALALDPEAGRLHVAFPAGVLPAGTETEAGATYALLHTSRAVSVTGVITGTEGVPAPPLPTPTPGPTPTPTPTPRPEVPGDAPASGMPTIEAGPLTLPVLALGGIGFAVVIVGAVIILRMGKRGNV